MPVRIRIMSQRMGEWIHPPLPEEDCSGVQMLFHRSATEPATLVTFKIPDSAGVLSRSYRGFLTWVFKQLVAIAEQAEGIRP